MTLRLIMRRTLGPPAPSSSLRSGGLKEHKVVSAAGVPPAIDWNYLAERFLAKHYNLVEPGRQYGHWMSALRWEQLLSYQPRSQGVFHPSGIGESACQRQVIFDLLCAHRSPTDIPPRLARILDNGSNRHVGLHVLFLGLAYHQFAGVEDYKFEIQLDHAALPISGHPDGVIKIGGYWYVLDFKTINNKGFASCYEPSDKHRAQLRTYMLMAGVKAGYIIYENKDNQTWATPMRLMRVDPEEGSESSVEGYCRGVLSMVKCGDMPEYIEKVCKANITFCAYQKACSTQRETGCPMSTFDRRSPEVRARQERAG